MHPDRRARLLLAAGALAGLILALVGTLSSASEEPESAPAAELPEGVLADVNGKHITTARFERDVARLAKDKRNALTERDRAEILERLIEEELLIQRGVELGLVETHQRVRKALASAMIRFVVEPASSAPPDNATLRAFYEEERAFFTPAARLRVKHLFFSKRSSTGSPLERATTARAALLTGSTAVESDPTMLSVPNALLPPAKLRDYLGPSLLEAAEALAVGQISEPIEMENGAHLVQLLERSEALAPDFESIRSEVEQAWSRRQGDARLKRYLQDLRTGADVRLAPHAPRLR